MNRSRQREDIKIGTVFTAVYYPNQNYDTNGGKSPLPLPLYRLWADLGNLFQPTDNMLGKAYNEKREFLEK